MESDILKMRIAAMTHQGIVRSHNEDCIGINEWARSLPMKSPVLLECIMDESRLCVIADGLGGHAGGEIASAIAVRELSLAAPVFSDSDSITNTLHSINKRLYDIMQSSPQFIGMGAVVVGLVSIGTDICIFNIGDCRAYLAVGGYLRLISIDDTVGAHIFEPSGRTGINSHGILQSLGGLPTFQAIQPHIFIRKPNKGDRYLLCSDGLTDMLDLDSIEICLSDNPVLSIDSLIKKAINAGGKDNISVMIIDFF